jgi:tetratricopeptide (TPR) repeat protein
MLSTELAAGEQLRMVPAEQVTRAQMELSVSDADSLSAETLARLRSELGSDVVVMGSYTVVGEKAQPRIRVDLRIQDALAGETIAEVATTGTERDLFELVSQAGAHLRDQLGVSARSKDEAATVRASMPSNPEAARFYAEGLARLRNFDALLARNLLHEAVAAEPNYPLSHAALATAWSALGYDSKAREEAQQAFKLSGKLSREEQLLVEGSYRQATKDWAQAVENYRSLFALFPDNLDYGVLLIQAQVSSANARDAQATLDALRKLPAPSADDPRIDLAETGIAWLLSDAKRVLAIASRAATKAEAQGARLLLARAQRERGAACRRLGENAQALTSYAEARQIAAAAGDRAFAAGVLRDIADTTAEQGDYSSALELYRQSLAVVREIGFKGGVAADFNNMGVVFENQRDFRSAQKMYEQALAKFREVDNKSQAAISLGNIGEVLFYQGKLAAAESRYRQAIDSAHDIGDSDNAAYQIGNMGILLETRGDLAGARNAFEHALSLWGASDPHASSAIKVQLGELQLIQDDLAGARKSQEEALAIREKLGEKGSIAESRLALAALSLEEGRPADAEVGAREAAAEFQTEKIPDLEAVAYALVARSLMEQGEAKLEGAATAVDRAVSLSANSQEPMIRLLVAIIAERVRVAGGASAADQKNKSIVAHRKLQAVLAEAEKSGLFGLKLEAQLALGEMEMKFGPAATGRSELALLEKTAQTKGYRLIARKAAAAKS